MASPVIMPPVPAPAPTPTQLGGPRQPPVTAGRPSHSGTALDPVYAMQLKRAQAAKQRAAQGYQGFKAPGAPRPNMVGSGPIRIPDQPTGISQQQKAASMAQAQGLASMAPADGGGY